MTIKSISLLFKKVLKGELIDVIYGIYVGRVRKLDLEGVSVKDLGLPPERSIFYSNSGGPELKSVFRSLSIQSNDRILDIGCGKGGAIITMACFPFERIDGVEIHKELIIAARNNFAKMNINNCYIYCSDASSFKKYDDYNYIYMSHPFKSVVMRDVVKNIEESIKYMPRLVTIVYKHPVCHDDIVAGGIFTKIADYEMKYPSSAKLFVYKNMIDW